MDELSKYSRASFDDLTTNELTAHIHSLQALLKKRFGSSSDFNETLVTTLQQLKAVGHTLYSLDYDSDIYRFREVWGTNYRDSGVLGLEIEFESPDRIVVEWIDTLESK
jgi:hypothetical protein